MIGNVVNWTIQRKLSGMIQVERRRGGAVRETLCEIHESFGAGIAASLRREPAEPTRAKATRMAWNRRAFFWEGYAFGLAGRHAMSLRRSNPETSRITSQFNGMHFTGYGFWNGMARGPLRISLDLARFGLVEGHFEKYAPMMVGGEAFGLVSSAGELNGRILKRLRFPDNRCWALAARHGCGRALWFVYIDEPERLTEVIASFPELANDLVEGLGHAITFTFAKDLEKALRFLHALPDRYRSGLVRGAGMALESFAQEDLDAESHLSPRDADLQEAWKVIRQTVEETGYGPGWYSHAAEAVRRRFP